MTTGKTIDLTRQTFVGKVMFLLFNMLSRLVIYADDIIFTAESEEELQSLLMRVKEESEKAGLRLNIQETKIWSQHFMTNRRGKEWKHWQVLLSWAPKSLQIMTAATKLKHTCSLDEKLWQNYTLY